AMRAVSFNLQSAKLMGINTDRVIMFTFALGSALAAAAGVLVAIRIPRIDPLMGILVGLKAFVAAVLGGIGNIPGAMLGGLLIGITETMVVGYLSPTYKDAVAFAILILILLFRPSLLLGTVAPEQVSGQRRVRRYLRNLIIALIVIAALIGLDFVFQGRM